MIVLAVIALLFGLIVGSFLNNVIFRLRAGEQFVTGRSRCPHCQQHLRWFELIPVFSFLWQRGRCTHCEAQIDKQYPLVELSMGLLFALAVVVELGPCLQNLLLAPCGVINYFTLVRDWVVIAFLLVIFVYDLRWHLILDQVTMPAMVVILLLNLQLSVISGLNNNSTLIIGQPLLELLLAALVGGGFFFLQFFISQGRWIGGGDIRLGLLMGLVLGWPQVVWALMLAYFIGAGVSIILLSLRKKSWSSQIPFGTFLSLATLVILFWGEYLVQWYLGILG